MGGALGAAVEVKGVELGRVGLVGQAGQEGAGELETAGVGGEEVVDCLKELDEHWGALLDFLSFKAQPPHEGMAERHKLLLDQHPKPIDRPVERIDDNLRQTHNLAHPIHPAHFLYQHIPAILHLTSFTFICSATMYPAVMIQLISWYQRPSSLIMDWSLA